ncbi:MAG TPA: helix-turn-helix domain-containing protein [Polyangiales bacterium]|nr:helix-turn-helix domain-containing protein [Polyangiales bacterium]
MVGSPHTQLSTHDGFTALYHWWKPSEPLRPFVESLWYFAGSDFVHARERILPNGRMGLLINLAEDELRSYHGEQFELIRTAGAALCGTFAQHFAIDTSEQRAVVGVNFRPGGAWPFFNESASAVANQHVPLDVLWGRDGAVLRDRLLSQRSPDAILQELDRVLLERMVRPLQPDRAIEYALKQLARGTPVFDLRKELGKSPRRFIRDFELVVGLTPKRYARIQRFARLLQTIELTGRIAWTQTALRFGYYDQAHLIRDFREFAGQSPTHYQPRAAHDRTHVPLSST